ncbi:MAG: alcohol dehydrogenase catalytic domain-containing protein, partial [Pseudomonadota bacterium]
MKAIDFEQPGNPEVLRLVDRETPTPREEEILIEVECAGVNRPDVLQRLGKYPVPKDADPLLGLEVSGTVSAVGTKTSRYKVGDQVSGLSHGGG